MSLTRFMKVSSTYGSSTSTVAVLEKPQTPILDKNQSISQLELQLHTKLTKNLTLLLPHIPPGTALHPSTLSTAMTRVRMYDGGWKGTLHRRIFGTPSNFVGRNAFGAETGLVKPGIRVSKKMRVE